ncbi:hypothetical protein [Mucilaginibacter rubeus]|nr:hypothetical protein [Mucilaginibacter rubeus]QTE56061.1 hypothetical protein J3L23_28325 [Mucilaginibacter rubeus]QTE64475.1 hypothetical protein J3L22_05500 [Mucilaginibacter rubeus]QTF63235.1 hypothetical protein J3L20_05185 [Mucilaginibacter rubeus]
MRIDKRRLSSMSIPDKKNRVSGLNFGLSSKKVMKIIQKFTGYLPAFDTRNIKAAIFKVFITLVTLAAAALPWLLLIARVTLNGLD